MCTVSYIPYKENDFILTSNRDEKEARPTIPPRIYEQNGIKSCFPKDKLAGGSWIAANNLGRLCCLLNGGYEKHEKQDYHTESRGNVLLGAAYSQTSVKEYFQNKSLNKVEPFTIITIESNSLGVNYFSEFIWDGKNKNYRELDKYKPYIWSSSTLYSRENRSTRKAWFQKYLNETKNNINPQTVFGFHTGNFSDDSTLNVLMDLKNGLKTVSITQVVANTGKYQMQYTDLLKNENKTCLV